MSSSSKKSQYYCIGCKTNFECFSTKKQFLKVHLKSNPACKKLYAKCKYCKKTFYSDSSLKAHMRGSTNCCMKEMHKKHNSTEKYSKS